MDERTEAQAGLGACEEAEGDMRVPEGAEREPLDLEGAIEAMLFVTDGPISTTVFAEMMDVDVARVSDGLERLRARLDARGSGIVLREVAGGWRLYTKPEHDGLVERYVISWDTRRLSSAALETLAITAYMQPVTRADIASIRGVNSDSSVNSLVEKGLVHEVGTSDAPGNPVLYGTTSTFLERFGLRSASDLPPIEDFAPDDETRRLISERLSSASTAPEVTEQMVAEALTQFAGAVEKVDLSKLRFDMDDE